MAARVGENVEIKKLKKKKKPQIPNPNTSLLPLCHHLFEIRRFCVKLEEGANGRGGN